MKKFITPMLILIVIAAGAYGFIRFRKQKQNQAEQASYKTQVVERGTIEAIVGATGNVRSNQSAVLAWKASGTVAEVNAATGDVVAKDEVLAYLLDESLSETLINAEAELVSARKALDDLMKKYNPLAVSSAEKAVADAQKAVQTAERKLATLKSQAPTADIDAAKAQVVLAQIELEKAQKKFKPYANKPENDKERATHVQLLSEAQKAYDAAVRKLNSLLGNANAQDIAVAEADLALAQEQLADAEKELEKVLAGPKQEDLDAAEARITAAQATLDRAKLKAPFAATVTLAESKIGDIVSEGTMAFRLDDLSRLLVDVQISEVDINRVAPGQPATLTFDSIMGRTYRGEVVKVALVGNTESGVINFKVTIEISDPDENIKPGMRASANVTVDVLEDVLLVPNGAVRLKDNQRVVYIIQKDTSTLTPVNITLGPSSESMSAVIDGDLQAGDLLVLNPPSQDDDLNLLEEDY